MRNLKRALSLTLASVMLLGMMVVGAGAASYPDVDEKDNIEAIEVLQAVKVMVGDEKGNFGPDQPVNRAQMAVVMALLLDLDYDYYEGTNPFKDVPAWAAPYVAACYANGIVSGYDAYTYGSGDPVTAVQAASMMMRALGYFKYPSDYSNNGGFELATVKQASKIDLFRQINANAKDPLTRNQVAQLALNALKTPIVEADDKTFNLVDGNGNLVVTGGQVNYVVTASNQAFARAIDDAESNGNALNGVNGYIIELGEKLYNGDLKLNNDATDPFGRPSRYWEFDGKEIGTYAKKEMLKEEYTVEVTGKALYDLIGKATIDDTKYWDFNLYVDGVSLDDSDAEAMLSSSDNAFDGYFTRGELANNNKAGIGATGKGVLTQVFVDSDKKEVSIVIINTYLAKAQSDYKEKTDEVSLNVYKMANKGTSTDPVYVKFNTPGSSNIDVEDKVVLKALGEDFTLAKDAKENDLFLVTVAEGEIQTIADAEILSEVTLNAFKRGSWVESDNEQYDYASTAEYDVEVLDRYTSIDGKENLKDRKYNVILDKNGYLVGLELVEDVKNYVFVAGIDADKSNLKNQTAEANLIFMDGTRETAKVDMDKSTSAPVKLADNSAYDTTKGLLDGKDEEDGDFALLNTWCTYTVNANGVYTLTEVAKAIDDGTGTTAKTKIKTAQYHDDVNGAKINTKNTALAGALSGSYAKVYGNDNSVYLTAKLDYVRYDGTNYAAVISSADNVVTNIDKADITIESSTTVAAKDKFNNLGITSATAAGGVYTLYNDKGYVIAAMVVGKDAGATSNLVYVHTDDVERERYNPKTSRATTDGDWTWVRKVIFEGEEVELTETGDNLQYINASSMVEGSWYKVTFNANNEVISSASVFGGKADMVVGPGVNSADPAAKAEAIYRAVDINPSINEYDTVVFQRVYVGDSNDVAQYVVRPSLVGNTLYVETKNDTGVRVAEDVKTVLVQTKANKEETTYYTTSTQLKNIIDDLNDNGDGYKFQMNLVILKGAVRYVVIRDDIKDGYKPTEPTGSVKVSFFDTQYPVTGDNRYDFYVNGKLVTSFDETVPGEKSFKVAANDAIRVLVRGQANKFGADGDVTVDTADKVAGVVSAKSTILSFKATESLVLAPAGDIGAAGSDDDDNVAANVKGNLIVMKGTENVTGTAKVTKVEINAGDDGKVDNETDNKLKFTFTLPAGYEPNESTLQNNLSVTAMIDGAQRNLTVGTAIVKNTDDSYTWTTEEIGSTTTDALYQVYHATSCEVTLTFKVKDESTKPVTINTNVGVKDGDETNTDTLSTTTPAAITVSLILPESYAYATEVEIPYTVTGTGLTGELKAEGVAVADGTRKVNFTTSATKATGPVTVEVGTPVVSAVKISADKAASVTEGVTVDFKTTAPTEIEVAATAIPQDVEVTVTDTQIPNNSDVSITWKVTGATGDKVTGTKNYTLASGVATIAAADFGTIKVTGNEAVKVEITGVTYKTFDASDIASILDIIDRQIDGKDYASGAVIETNGGDNIALTKTSDGKYVNAKELTITLTYAAFSNANKTGTVTILEGYTGGAITTSATTASGTTVTFTIAAGTLTIDPAGTKVPGCIVAETTTP